MPILYEINKAILKASLKRPLNSSEIQNLRNYKYIMEQKTGTHIEEISITPKEIYFHLSAGQTQKFFVITMSVVTAIAVIAMAIGLPITAWFLMQPPAPGPLGIPQWFWVGLGVGIPLFGLGFLVIVSKR